jgi:hypothetical protein
MQKSISNGLGHARTHTKLSTSILVADTYLGTRLRLCLGSNSRAGYLPGPGQSRQAAAILARARR